MAIGGRTICTTCGKLLSAATLRNIAAGVPTTGKCADCVRDASRAAPRHCSDCGVRVSHMSLHGRCRSCAAKGRGAESEQKRVAAVRESMKRPEMLALKQAVARRNAAMRVAWCPEERRPEYRKLRHRMGAEKARAEIISQLSPFERQLALVASGRARIIEVPRIPTRGFEQSLTGNSAAMMAAL